MKKFIISLLVFILIISTIGCEDEPIATISEEEATTTISNKQTAYTKLNSPFNGNGDWYMTQAFGAYYYKQDDGKIIINGHHTGEDWNFAAGDGDEGKEVYPIAIGEVIGSGSAFKNDDDGSEAGFYIIVKHTGKFKIPLSRGAHILSLTKPETESGRASNYGKPMLYARDLFSNGTIIDYPLGEKVNDGTYSYPGNNSASAIYSVYMHIQDPEEYIKKLGNTQEITLDMLDKPIGRLMKVTNFPAHLHFEIRVGESDESVKKSVMDGKKTGGYFHSSQEMVVAGYREPSSIIQANLAEFMEGKVLGEKIDNTPVPVVESISVSNIYNEDLQLIFDVLNLKKVEAIDQLGDDYYIDGIGAEGLMHGYYYDNKGIALAFVPDYDLYYEEDPDTIQWIQCDNKIDINGARFGMTFNEIQAILGDTEVIDFDVEYMIIYSIEYQIGELTIYFVTYDNPNDETSEVRISLSQ